MNRRFSMMMVTTSCVLLFAAGCQRRAEGDLFRSLTNGASCDSTETVGDGDPEVPAPPLGDDAGGDSERELNLRWDVSRGCVPLTFDAELSAHEQEISAAVEAWNSVHCTRLCVAPPVAASEAGEAITRCKIHVRSPENAVAGLPDDWDAPVVSLVDYRESPASARGLIVGARLQVRRIEPELRAHLMHALGHALGFTHTSTVPSILSSLQEDWPTSGLSDGDRAAVIEKYGARESCP